MRRLVFIISLCVCFALSANGAGAENIARGVRVIVIDAGHGGPKFPGAHYRGIYEKDLNLKVALKLGALIERELPEVKVRQRPVDISLVVFQHGVDAFERDRQVVHHPRQTLLHVGQFGSGRRQHVARLGRHERVALRQQLRAVAHLDGDRLAAHETVAVNARLGVARNPEGAPHGELQHDVGSKPIAVTVPTFTP